jgi:hypothetical protein
MIAFYARQNLLSARHFAVSCFNSLNEGSGSMSLA